jgi:hypothetical protein
MSNRKLIFNISFHWHLPQLKWHLSNIFEWSSAINSKYLLVAAHKENLASIDEWIKENYPEREVDYNFINEDHGNHLGCTMNVIEGIKYIRDNKEYDYLINVEADNMFRDEDKMLKLIDEMEGNDKHMLLVDHHAMFGPDVHTRFSHTRKYFHATTLNIYSNYFVREHIPLTYNSEFMGFGWCGAPGTPFEAYLGLSFIKKHNLKTDQDVLDYFNKWGYSLSYDRNLNPCNYAEPDDLTPDRFMKYGILNCPNGRNSQGASDPDAWLRAKRFIELHKPLMYDFE